MPRRQKNRHGARFVILHHILLKSRAWLSLSPAARAVYIEIKKLYNGSNNGTLGLSARDAAERCRIGKDTATKAFKELEERRFIECAQKGAFSLKKRHASEWRLTDEVCNVTGALPTFGYNKWQPAEHNPVLKQAATVPEQIPAAGNEAKKAA